MTRDFKAEIAAAAQAVSAAKAEHYRAIAALQALHSEQCDSWAAADALLPKVTIRKGDGGTYSQVLVKRTASTVFTRNPGTNPEIPPQQWRRDKYSSDWHKHPGKKPYSWRSAETLILPDDERTPAQGE